MAIIKAFKAYRPIEELASKIAALPYDVMNTEEAREMAKVHRMDYKRQILELLQSITDEKILRRIYLMILTIIGAGR